MAVPGVFVNLLEKHEVLTDKKIRRQRRLKKNLSRKMIMLLVGTKEVSKSFGQSSQ
jgi:transcription initiation factor IIE alpha subunit